MAVLNRLRLRFARGAFAVGTTSASVALKLFGGRRKRYGLAFKWLGHYILGSGKPLCAPEFVMREEGAVRALLRAMIISSGTADPRQFPEGWTKAIVSSSTFYDGAGFWGRPTLFYLANGFTFYFKRVADRVLVRGKDVYDWHPARPWYPGEESQYDGPDHAAYFTSRLPRPLVYLGRLLVGREFFPLWGFPSGEPGVSNWLWEALEQVGARPFVTYIEAEYPIEYLVELADAIAGEFYEDDWDEDWEDWDDDPDPRPEEELVEVDLCELDDGAEEELDLF